jgi:hypothetical protein
MRVGARYSTLFAFAGKLSGAARMVLSEVAAGECLE